MRRSLRSRRPLIVASLAVLPLATAMTGCADDSGSITAPVDGLESFEATDLAAKDLPKFDDEEVPVRGDRFEAFTSALGLTRGQVDRLLALHEDHRDEVRALVESMHADAASRDEVLRVVDALRRELMGAIREILTEEQFEDFERFLSEHGTEGSRDDHDPRDAHEPPTPREISQQWSWWLESIDAGAVRI